MDNQHLERAVSCRCGWVGKTGELVAKQMLCCPKCGQDDISYVVPESTGTLQ